MSGTKAAAAGKKAAAAKGEVQPSEKRIDFEGEALVLPAQLPGDVLFALAGVDENPGEIVNIVGSIIGAEQLAAVRAKLAGRDFEATLGALAELMNAAISEYGTTAGESPASTRSSTNGTSG